MNTPLSRRTLIRQMAGLGALTLLSACDGQVVSPSPAPKLWRIGYLSGNTHASVENLSRPFVQELRDRGYVERRDIVVDFRIADNVNELLPAMAAELLTVPVDVLVAEAGPAQLAAKAATSTVPIVFVLGGDPIGNGLVASLARPGGNITGVTTSSTALGAKKVEHLKEMVPGLARVAVIFNANNGTITQARAVEEAARILGLDSEISGVHNPNELDAVLETIARGRFEGLVMTPALSVIRSYAQVPDFAAKIRLPQIFSDIEIVRAGGLMHLGANYAALHRAAAVLVDKILRGAKPADLPVEQPTEFDFIVNVTAAQRIGLVIPDTVLRQATEFV